MGPSDATGEGMMERAQLEELLYQSLETGAERAKRVREEML